MPRLRGSSVLAKKIGGRVREIRHEAKTVQTQESIALAARLNAAYVSQVESGKRLPSITALISLAAALGVEPYDLLAFEKNDPRVRLLDAIRCRDKVAFREAVKTLDWA